MTHSGSKLRVLTFLSMRAILGLRVVLSSAFSAALFGQTDVVTNGSLEIGTLGHWIVGTAQAGVPYNGTGPRGFNVTAPGPGTETITVTLGFPAAHGVNTALGSVHLASGTPYVCVLYQSVAISAGTTGCHSDVQRGRNNIKGLYIFIVALRVGIRPPLLSLVSHGKLQQQARQDRVTRTRLERFGRDRVQVDQNSTVSCRLRNGGRIRKHDEAEALKNGAS